MTDLTKAAQAVVSAWKAGELGLGIKEFSALEAALAAQQAAQPVAEVHAAHLRPAEDGGHWCREVLLYSGGNPGDQFANANRVKLYAAAQPQQATPYPASEYGVDQWWFKEMVALWCAIPGSTITHDQKRAAKIAVHAVQALIAAQPQQADLTRAGGAA